MYQKYFKRLFDIATSLVLFGVFLPLLLAISLALLINNRGKIFFLQMRPGLNQKPFNIIKFKTMNDKKDQYGNLLPNNQRLTQFGKFLRNYSLDEIPQLLNVLIGEMSIVGPRPLLFKYIPLYRPDQANRHLVKPGITGWAQINGRNAITWTKKFEYDIWYVENLSLKLDVHILLMTMHRVFTGVDINKSPDVTSEPFNGLN